MGMYDYVPQFDHLDAFFLEGAIGIGKGIPLGITDAIDWNLSIGFGNVLAANATNYNWSNLYFSIAAGMDYDLKNWTLGMRSKLQPRFFTAGSATDFHKGRKDLESELTTLVQYHYRNLTVTGHVLDLTSRRTWAVKASDEQAKSYLTLGGGVNVSSSFTPLGWLRAGKG